MTRASAARGQHRAANQRRDRAPEGIKAPFGEHDPLQALVGVKRPSQDRAMLVDEFGEGRFGDREERNLVRRLGRREFAL